MPNPKRRHSKSRQALRRSHLALKPLQLARCARCGSVTRPHRVCDTCGYYGFSKGSEKKGTEVFHKEDF
jgi:large subunit ribosomal protein L32